MAEAVTQVPVRTPKTGARGLEVPTFESLRREVDHLFDVVRERWRSPFAMDLETLLPRDMGLGAMPAMDITQDDKSYMISAEVPGMEEKDIDLRYSEGLLTIRAEREETKEEKKEGYFLSERHHGTFLRSLRVPNGIDPAKIDAKLKNGILTITLPKTTEAQKHSKKITIAKG